MNHPFRSGPILFLAMTAFVITMAYGGDIHKLEQKPKPVVKAERLAKLIHAQINEERSRHGFVSLAWDPALARIAGEHSRDMADRNYLAHDSPDGRSFVDRYRRAKYTCRVRTADQIHFGAENIALGRSFNSSTTVGKDIFYDWNTEQDIVQRVVEGWMQSDGHRHNILTPYWRREGIGVEIHPGNRIYVTQNFC